MEKTAKFTAEEILDAYETVSIMTDYDQYEPHWGKDSVLQAMEAYASQFKQPSEWISVEDRLKDVIDKARVYNGGWVFTEAEIIDEFIKTSI